MKWPSFQAVTLRGFAERVRSTLKASGAKRNAEVLEAAGLASPGTSVPGSSERVSESVGVPPGDSRPPARRAAATGSPSLFDAIYETEAAGSDFNFGANTPADTWSYAGY